MVTRRAFVLSLLTAIALCTPWHARSDAQPTMEGANTPAGHAAGPHCLPRADRRMDLAQGLPVDCCKGHKGVCGCRAGKIVCCDGTVSKLPECTCHSDWGGEN